MAIFFRQQMIQNVEYAKVHVNSELKVNMTTKKCTNAWTFTITSKVSLEPVQKGNSAGSTERVPWTIENAVKSLLALNPLNSHLQSLSLCIVIVRKWNQQVEPQMWKSIF